MVDIPNGYVLFYPTNRCNYRCKHCVVQSLDTPKNELTLDEIKTIWGNSNILKQVKTSIVGGEPFVRNDIIDIAEFMLTNKCKVSITTNGAFPEKMKELIKRIRPNLKDFNVLLSIDGLEKTHDSIRGKGAFHRAMQTFFVLKEFNCELYVNTVLQKDNLSELEMLTFFFKDILKVTNGHPPLKSFAGSNQYYNIKEVYGEHIEEILPYVYLDIEKQYLLNGGNLRISNCHAGQSSCYIDPEGNVFACLTAQENFEDNSLLMGNLRDYNYNFDELWISDSANRARENVKRCVGCFSGCEYSREISLYNGGEFKSIQIEEKMAEILNKGLCYEYMIEEYHMCAEIFYHDNDYESAILCLEKAKILDESNEDTWHNLLILYATVRDIKSAINSYNHLSTERKNSEEVNSILQILVS